MTNRSLCSTTKAWTQTQSQFPRCKTRHQWRLGPAAKDLDISRTTLYRLIDDCPSIRKAADLGADEIAAVLEAARGNISRAAVELRVSVQGLKRRMTDLGLS